MSMCHCDGPTHPYDPSWCGAGKGDNNRPINPELAYLEARLRLERQRWR